MERILIAINVRWWNAEAHYGLNLASGLQDLGHEVTVLVNPDSPAEKRAEERGLDWISYIMLDSNSLFVQARNYRELLELILDRRITMIQSFKASGGILFSLLKKSYPNLKHVKTRGQARPPKINWGNKLLYGPWGADGLVSVGRSVDRWLDELGQGSSSFEYQNRAMIPYGAEEVKIGEDTGPNPLNLPVGARVITLLGRTQEVKGHSVLLEAFAQLEDTNSHLLFLVKKLDEFPQVLENLTSRIKELNLESRVHIKGPQKDLAPWLSLTDIAAIPSLDSEVNCRTTVEFMSASVPLVVFPTGTLPDIILHKETGFICEDKTLEALKKGLSWMLNEADLTQLGARARQDYNQNYTQEILAKRYLDFYQLVRS
ncbi:MAG: glycosyltransferase family 4 protein [SAR324 cluster bacterium]|nr:glycosyltransferase family 4 protein [SAR324 cluster bacterium]